MLWKTEGSFFARFVKNSFSVKKLLLELAYVKSPLQMF